MSGTLNHQPADILRYLAIDLGVGTLPTDNNDWPAYVTNEPDTPDSCLTFYDTSPIKQGRIMYSGETQWQYGVMVQARAPTEQIAYAKIKDLAEAFDGVSCDTVVLRTSTYVVYSVSQTSMVPMGQDPTSHRYYFSLNLLTNLKLFL